MIELNNNYSQKRNERKIFYIIKSVPERFISISKKYDLRLVFM